MVNKLRSIYEKLIEKFDSIDLFVVARMDDFTNKWSIILSSSNITEDNRKMVFRTLVYLIQENLSAEEIAKVARIGIFDNDEYLVEKLLEHKEGHIINEETTINGNTIYEAHFFASNS